MLSMDWPVEQEGLAYADILKVNTAGGEREVAEGYRELLRHGRIGTILLLDWQECRSILEEFVGYS